MSKTESRTNSNGLDPFDPTGILKGMRDANMDAWAKLMGDFVNTEAYAESTGAMLDAWLTASGPLRQALEQSMSKVLAELNLTSRDDIARLAERLTHIEMRLDDMEAQIDEALPARSE